MAGGVRYIPEEFGKPKEYCHPHHRLPTDLEPAFVIGKDESCCPPTGDPCECVTSGDIEKWNFVYDNFSALTGIDVSAINDIVDDVSALNSSAELWNGTYETVSANSATWDSVNDLQLSAEDHEKRISNLEEFRDETVDDLNYIEDKLENLHFDNDITNPYHSISGDGSSSAPFGVSDYFNLRNINDNYEELNSHIVKFSADGNKNTLYEFDGAAYNVARIDSRLSGIDQTNDAQNNNIQRNYELITEVANRQKGKQDKLDFGYNSSGYIVSINNSALVGEMGGLTGDVQGALDQVYENSASWNEVSAKVDITTFNNAIDEIDENIANEIADRIESDEILSAAIDAEKEQRISAYNVLNSALSTEIKRATETENDLYRYIDEVVDETNSAISGLEETIESVSSELSAAIDTKQHKLEAGDHIEITSGADADVISVTGLNTFTYFSANYGTYKSTDYFALHVNKLSANSAIGYFNLSIGYKVETSTAADIDTLYNVGININGTNIDTHYINGMIPAETFYINKNILNDGNEFTFTIINDPEITVKDITIGCIGFMGEAEPEHENLFGFNNNILTFGGTSALRL